MNSIGDITRYVEALREAAARWGAPQIVNTDQGSQFSSAEFVAEVARIRVVDPVVVDGLKRAMTARHPVLAAAAEIRDVKAGGGLNIEALEMSADQQRLLIGFRSPLQAGRALIASVENPAGIFEADEAPQIADVLAELDLGGQGIRGLSYVPSIGAYLVVAGPVSREQAPFELWLWSGQQGAPAHRVVVPGLKGFERAEGVSPAVIDGVEHIIIVSDDGNREAGRCASFLLLDAVQLQACAGSG